jgi:hypothetical protein
VPIYTVDVVEFDHRGYPSRWRVRRADEATAYTAVVDRDYGCHGEPPSRTEAVCVSVLDDLSGRVVSSQVGDMSDSLRICFDLLAAAESV